MMGLSPTDREVQVRKAAAYRGEGVYSCSYVTADGLWLPPLFTRHNEWMYGWGVIAARVLGLRDLSYVPAALYIEFENVDDPEDAATVSDIDRSDTIEFYENLSSDPSRDFLRVPFLLTPSLSIATGYEDYIPAGQGNKLTFNAVTQGTEGVHGKPFSDSVNSKVSGVAVVATPSWSDRTRDVVYARDYYAVEEQVAKLPSSQVGIAYSLTFP